MNKITSLLVIFNLSGWVTLVNADCHYTNNELQNMCIKIEQNQREASQTLQTIYDKAMPKGLSSMSSIPPVSNIPANHPTNTAKPNTSISNKPAQFNIFSDNNDKKSIFK